MKLILTLFVVTVLLASVAVTASAADVLDLSTLGKKPSTEAVSLPRLSPTMPTMWPPRTVSMPSIESRTNGCARRFSTSPV